MTQYLLTRTLPDGTEKSHRPLGTIREVEFAVAYGMVANTRIPRGEARTFAHRVAAAPFGETVRHETSGYVFRVERV